MLDFAESRSSSFLVYISEKSGLDVEWLVSFSSFSFQLLKLRKAILGRKFCGALNSNQVPQFQHEINYFYLLLMPLAYHSCLLNVDEKIKYSRNINKSYDKRFHTHCYSFG